MDARDLLLLAAFVAAAHLSVKSCRPSGEHDIVAPDHCFQSISTNKVASLETVHEQIGTMMNKSGRLDASQASVRAGF